VDLVVKLRDDVTSDELDKVRYSIMQHINDISIYVDDRFNLAKVFAEMAAPANIFTITISLMILSLSFFMMTVSFS